MKKILSLAVLLFFFTPQLFSQWNPQGSGVWSNIYSVFSIDGQTAWISGAYGIILKTTNSGASWVQKNSGTSLTLGYIYFFNENEGIAAGNNGTIKRTTDGGNTWYTVSSGTSNNLNDGSVINDSLMYLIGWNGTLLITTDMGDTWEQKQPISSSNYHWVQFWDENLGWASTWFNGQIWKTTDGGNTWSMKAQVGSISLWQVCFVTPEKGFAVGEWGVIIKSTDGGENWTQYFAGTTENLHAVTFITPEVGWIVGKDETLLKTSNGGDSWIIEHTGNDYEYLQVYFYDENIGWILGTPGFWSGNASVILFTDNGGIPVKLVSFAGAQNNNKIHIFWITASELNKQGFEIERKTTDDWKKIGFVNGNGTTTEMQYYSYKDFDLNNGLYYYRLKQIDYDGTTEIIGEVEVLINNTPVDYSLQQNFPNPFNPSTIISFTVPEHIKVLLKVYNVLGTEVAELVNDIKSPGRYEVEFNSNDLTSGIYFYTIQASKCTDAHKMILLK